MSAHTVSVLVEGVPFELERETIEAVRADRGILYEITQSSETRYEAKDATLADFESYIYPLFVTSDAALESWRQGELRRRPRGQFAHYRTREAQTAYRLWGVSAKHALMWYRDAFRVKYAIEELAAQFVADLFLDSDQWMRPSAVLAGRMTFHVGITCPPNFMYDDGEQCVADAKIAAAKDAADRSWWYRHVLPDAPTSTDSDTFYELEKQYAEQQELWLAKRIYLLGVHNEHFRWAVMHAAYDRHNQIVQWKQGYYYTTPDSVPTPHVGQTHLVGATWPVDDPSTARAACEEHCRARHAAPWYVEVTPVEHASYAKRAWFWLLMRMTEETKI